MVVKDQKNPFADSEDFLEILEKSGQDHLNTKNVNGLTKAMHVANGARKDKAKNLTRVERKREESRMCERRLCHMIKINFDGLKSTERKSYFL